jgi:hypothetical protein
VIKAALLALAMATGVAISAAPPPVAHAVPTARTAADVAIDQALIIEEMVADYPVDVSVRWVPCGMENAWYHRIDLSITLCLELVDMKAPVFVAAHEAGHALSLQLGLDMGDGPTAVEDAADDLAALVLLELGEVDEVVAAAKWFMQMSQDQLGARHSTHEQRAWKLLCLADGYEKGTLQCRALYAMTRAYWAEQLEPHRL